MECKHKIRKANEIQQEKDCCRNRYEYRIKFICSCGVKACRVCMQEHLISTHIHLGANE